MIRQAILVLAFILSPAQDSVDLLIVGGRVFDGSGNPWQYKNIGIMGDRIAWIGGPTETLPSAKRTVDAKGLYLSPGFIDLHTHTADALENKALSANLNYLHQGVTTVVVGNDGSSPWPIAAAIERYQNTGIGPNVALLVGHGTVRQKILQMEDRAPTPEELEKMKELVRQGMREGAIGISTGLYYAPGSYAQTPEIIALAQEVQKFGGFYDSHIRDESDYSVGLLKAIEEVIEIGRRARLPVHISHIKAFGPGAWGQSPGVIEVIEKARHAGIEATANQYPYEASSTSIAGALIPRWVQAGGNEKMRARIQDREQRSKILAEIDANLRRRGGADKLVIASHRDSSLEGKNLKVIADAWEISPAEAALKIVEAGGASVVSFSMQEPDIVNFMRQDWVATASDGSTGPFGRGKPHPRGYGTFPRKIQVYVEEKKTVTLPFAIRAATSLPAAIAGLADRGILEQGNFADIMIFDLENLRERATYEHPHQYAQGVVYLLINGHPVIDKGKYTGELPGRILRGLISGASARSGRGSQR